MLCCWQDVDIQLLTNLQSFTLLKGGCFFMQEFERMSQPGYHLTKVRDFYILTIDRAHANNIRHAQALKSALVELSHEEGDGSSPSPANSSKLFPAMEERSLSLPNIMPLASPDPTSEGPASRALELSAGGSTGGGISSGENRPCSGSDDKFPKEQMTEEMRSVLVPMLFVPLSVWRVPQNSTFEPSASPNAPPPPPPPPEYCYNYRSTGITQRKCFVRVHMVEL